MGSPALVVFASGQGSNLQALIDACADGRLAAHIALVVVNRPGAAAAERAARAGIPVLLRPRQDQDRGRWEQDLADAVAPWAPALLVLAGWDQLLRGPLLAAFPERILNLHPALPGDLPGLGAIARAHRRFREGGTPRTGVMVHWVTAEVDAGPVLLAEALTIGDGEALGELEARVHRLEHALLVHAVALALGRAPGAAAAAPAR